jgi:hypothetical protein
MDKLEIELEQGGCRVAAGFLGPALAPRLALVQGRVYNGQVSVLNLQWLQCPNKWPSYPPDVDDA